MSRLLRLYPRDWRDRYETEFLSLIEARPPSAVERFDIVRGALDAHLHPQVRRSVDAAPLPPVPEGDRRLARRLGLAAAFGGVVWPAALGIALMGPVVYDGDGAYRDGSAAAPLLIVAMVLLAVGLLGQLVLLPAGARLARRSAVAAYPLFLIFGFAPWYWPIGLTAICLLALLAIGGLRSGVWPIGASLAVTAACIGAVAVGVIGAAVAGGDRMASGAFFLVAALVLVPAWLGVGAALIRRPAFSDASES